MPNLNARVNWRVDDFCRTHGISRALFYNEVMGAIAPVLSLNQSEADSCFTREERDERNDNT